MKKEHRRGFSGVGPALTAAKPEKPIYREYAEHFEKLLRMRTYPIAVKMVEKEEDIPELAKRPLRDFGYQCNTCQIFAAARRHGEVIAQMQEDMWCMEPVIAYGFTGGKPNLFQRGYEYFLSGKTRWPEAVKDLQTGRKWAHQMPCLEPGKYVAIVTAPLMRAPFEPDLVVLYVDPNQMSQLLMGVVCQWGEWGVRCIMAGHAGCVNYVVPSMKNGDFNVSNPCGGDGTYAAKAPDEFVFTAPMSKVEELLQGMDHLYDIGWGLPYKIEMQPHAPLPESYRVVAEIMGMR